MPRTDPAQEGHAVHFRHLKIEHHRVRAGRLDRGHPTRPLGANAATSIPASRRAFEIACRATAESSTISTRGESRRKVQPEQGQLCRPDRRR